MMIGRRLRNFGSSADAKDAQYTIAIYITTSIGNGTQKDKANGIHLIARCNQRTRHRKDDNPKPIQKDNAVLKHGAFAFREGIALRMSRFEGHEVAARRVGAMAMGLYATADWQGRIEKGEARLVTVLDDQAHLPEAKWLRDAFPDAVTGFRSNSREVQVWAAKSGAGIAALARYRADAEPGLVRLRTDIPDLVRDIWLGVHVDMRHMPRVRAVMDAVIKTLERQAPILVPKGT